MLTFFKMLSLRRRSVPAPRPPNRRIPRVEELEPRVLLSILSPAQVRHAYGFDQIRFAANGRTFQGDGTGQTIAIVDAYDDPRIASDLHVFDQAFGLPDPVLVKATPEGPTPTSALWSSEIALDVEWAHAMAPGAKILLVEAASNDMMNLLGAVDFACRQPGVVAVSMSWGASEFYGENWYDGYFVTPTDHLGGSSGQPGAAGLPGGITFVASSGDWGAWYGTDWPAVSPKVLSVGATALTLDSMGNYAGESAWRWSGGGYSSYEYEPYYQDTAQRTGWRSNPDVAAVGAWMTGLWVYDSMNGAWFSDSGTSAAAPQWAALIAVADQGRALAGEGSLDGASQTLPALYQLAHSSPGTYFHDITSGNNGYATTAGYDPVTGLGTPRADALVSALVNLGGSDTAVTFASASATSAPAHFQHATTDRFSTALAYGPGTDAMTVRTSGQAGSRGEVASVLAPALSGGTVDVGVVSALAVTMAPSAAADAPWQVSFTGTSPGSSIPSPENPEPSAPAVAGHVGSGEAASPSDAGPGAERGAGDENAGSDLWFNLAPGWDSAPSGMDGPALMDQAAVLAALALASPRPY
jgi:subtilase family serine protease